MRRSREELLDKTMLEVFPDIESTPMFSALQQCLTEQKLQQLESCITLPDGTNCRLEIRMEAVPEGVLIISLDVTAHKRVEEERKMKLEILQLINSAEDWKGVLKPMLKYLKDCSGCDALGIRIKEGDDFPYFETLGLSGKFVRLENYLCIYNENGEIERDSNGDPIVECMCGNILCGRFDPSKSFFTDNGCFWSNCTTELLATTTDSDRQTRTRNRCNGEGYESVVLIPLRSGDKTFGLIQFNDKRKGRFTLELIAFYRRIADHIANFLDKRQAEDRIVYLNNVLRGLIPEFIRKAMTSNKIVMLEKPEYSNPPEDSRIKKSIQSAMIIALKQKNKIYGFMIACQPSILTDCNESKRLLNEIANDITFALYSMVIEEEKNKSATELSNIQTQFRQIQKLDAIGRLAAGIAHDFNNILMVQMGYCDLMEKRLMHEDALAKDLIQIKACSKRAADLTRQLLAFSRKQPLQPEVLDLNTVVLNLGKMLRRLISEDIDFVLNLDKDLGRVKADPGQVEQIIMNLVVNARDAMPDGGKLAIKTGNVFYNLEYPKKHLGASEYSHVMLEISDTGIGMDDETKTKLFEPFLLQRRKVKALDLDSPLFTAAL